MNKPNVLVPRTMIELSEILEQNNSDLSFLAGGTDLLVKMRSDLISPKIIVDLSYLSDLKGILEKEDGIFINALTTYTDILENSTVKEKFPALFNAITEIGSPLIRNRATIGGNIVNASPAGDSIPALYIYSVKVHLLSPNGERIIPINEFFTGPGKSVIQKNEILTKIFIPFNDFNLHYFKKYGPRKALSISKLSLALGGKYDDKLKKFISAKIALGSVAPTVVYANKTAEFLCNNNLSMENISKAVEIILTEFTPIDDIRSTAEYRKQTIGETLRLFLTDLLENEV